MGKVNSPYINRFLQPDTLIPGVGSPQSWNRYSYTSNNPVNYSDPTGHAQENDDDGGDYDPNYCDSHPVECGGSGGDPNDNGSNNNPDDECPVNDPDCQLSGDAYPQVNNCPGDDYSAVSICVDLSASEMQELYENIGNYNDALFWTGLATTVIDALAVTILSTTTIFMFALALGASVATASAIVALAPFVATAAFVIGIAILASRQEMSGIQSSMFESGAGEYGGTLTVADYLLFKTYSVTTDKGSFTSWGITNVTPAIIGFDVSSDHPEWFQAP